MGWRDLVLDRITEDDSGGGFTPNFFQRSGARKKYLPNTNDPIGSMELPPAQEEPVSNITEPWRPSTNRRTMSGYGMPEQGPAMTDYLAHIQNVPGDNGENYSPSIWRRMLAGLSGGAAGATGGALQGIKAAQYINEIPYRRAVEDYERKGSALESAAKIEETTNRTRQQYQKELLEQETADKDREVKWANSEINRIKAEQAAKRIALEAEAKRATNQVAVDRLNEEIRNNDRDYNSELAKLELLKQGMGIRQQQANTGQYSAETARSIGQQNATTNASRGVAYGDYMDRLGRNKPPTQSSIGIGRRIIEEELKNQYPKILDPKTGAVKPEYAPEFERMIQDRLRERGLSGAPTGSRYIPEP